MDKKSTINKIRSIIRKVAPNAEVILFGSQARGDARPDSDFDILILEDTDKLTYERIREITTPLFMLFYDEGIDVQPIVKSKKEWRDRPFLTPFYCNVINEGIVL